MHQFRRLDVWHAAVQLAVEIYRLTRAFPREEQFGLVTQMRRAAVSVSSNIAEGAGRGSPSEFARFLRIAIGSVCELESQLELSRKLGFSNDVEGILSDAGVVKARIRTLEDRILTPGS